MTGLAPLKRALISVSDKSGLLDLAQALAVRDVKLLSTGGSAKAMRDVGLEVTVQMCIQIFRSNSDSQTERPSIRGIYLPMLHPKPLLLESNRGNYRPPIPLVFNSETRAFLPLAAQEEEETTLFESLPWPPLLPLFAGQVSISRSLSCSLTLFYALARSLSLSVALFRSLSCSLSSPVLR